VCVCVSRGFDLVTSRFVIIVPGLPSSSSGMTSGMCSYLLGLGLGFVGVCVCVCVCEPVRTDT